MGAVPLITYVYKARHQTNFNCFLFILIYISLNIKMIFSFVPQ